MKTHNHQLETHSSIDCYIGLKNGMGGCTDIGVLRLIEGFTLISTEDLHKLQTGFNKHLVEALIECQKALITPQGTFKTKKAHAAYHLAEQALVGLQEVPEQTDIREPVAITEAPPPPSDKPAIEQGDFLFVNRAIGTICFIRWDLDDAYCQLENGTYGHIEKSVIEKALARPPQTEGEWNWFAKAVSRFDETYQVYEKRHPVRGCIYNVIKDGTDAVLGEGGYRDYTSLLKTRNLTITKRAIDGDSEHD